MANWMRYSDCKDSGIPWLGSIPAHWIVAPVGVRYEVQLGKMLDEKKISGEHLAPYLRNVDVQWDQVSVVDLPRMDFAPLDRKKFQLRDGDLLVCEGGDVGRAAIWTSQLPECYYQKALHRLRALRPAQDLPRFMYYLLRLAHHQQRFSSSAGKATIAHLPAESLRRYRFPFPSMQEQRAIVHFLDAEISKVHGLIAKQERLIELLTTKRQAVIHRAVTRGFNASVTLKESGVPWIGRAPTHWQISRLKEVTQLESGHTPSKTVPEYWENCDIPWVSLNDSKQLAAVDYISETAVQISQLGIDNSSARLLPAQSVVFTRDATIGLAAITTRPMAVSQHVIAWVPTGKVLPLYLLRVLNAMRPFLDFYTAGATIKTIGMEDVKKLVMAVPPLPEQQQILDLLEPELQRIDALTAKCRRAIDLLREHRASLISAVVTGKIRVTEAAPQPEELATA